MCYLNFVSTYFNRGGLPYELGPQHNQQPLTLRSVNYPRLFTRMDFVALRVSFRRTFVVHKGLFAYCAESQCKGAYPEGSRRTNNPGKQTIFNFVWLRVLCLPCGCGCLLRRTVFAEHQPRRRGHDPFTSPGIE